MMYSMRNCRWNIFSLLCNELTYIRIGLRGGKFVNEIVFNYDPENYQNKAYWYQTICVNIKQKLITYEGIHDDN